MIIREKNSLKVPELAAIIGVTRQSIYEYERGETTPSKPVLYKIAKALGVTVADLYSENVNQNLTLVREPDPKNDIRELQGVINYLEAKVERLTKELEECRKRSVK